MNAPTAIVFDAVSEGEFFALIAEGAAILQRLDENSPTFWADLRRGREILVLIGDGQSSGSNGHDDAELDRRGSVVADYVDEVMSGRGTAPRLPVGPIGADAAARMRAATGLDVDDSTEVIIASNVLHAMRRHPDLTRQDWLFLPQVTNRFDDVAIGRPDADPKVTRLIVRRMKADDIGYGAVLVYASGGSRGKRLSVLTFFKDTSSALDAWWQKNKGSALAGVPDLTEPASNAPRPQAKPSLSRLAPVAPDGKVEPQEGDNKIKDGLTYVFKGGQWIWDDAIEAAEAWAALDEKQRLDAIRYASPAMQTSDGRPTVAAKRLAAGPWADIPEQLKNTPTVRLLVSDKAKKMSVFRAQAEANAALSARLAQERNRNALDYDPEAMENTFAGIRFRLVRTSKGSYKYWRVQNADAGVDIEREGHGTIFVGKTKAEKWASVADSLRRNGEEQFRREFGGVSGPALDSTTLPAADTFRLIAEGAAILQRLDENSPTFWADLRRGREILVLIGDGPPVPQSEAERQLQEVERRYADVLKAHDETGATDGKADLARDLRAGLADKIARINRHLSTGGIVKVYGGLGMSGTRITPLKHPATLGVDADGRAYYEFYGKRTLLTADTVHSLWLQTAPADADREARALAEDAQAHEVKRAESIRQARAQGYQAMNPDTVQSGDTLINHRDQQEYRAQVTGGGSIYAVKPEDYPLDEQSDDGWDAEWISERGYRSGNEQDYSVRPANRILDSATPADTFHLISEGARLFAGLDEDAPGFFADLDRLREILMMPDRMSCQLHSEDSLHSEDLAALAGDIRPVDLGEPHNRARDEVVEKGRASSHAPAMALGKSRRGSY